MTSVIVWVFLAAWLSILYLGGRAWRAWRDWP